MKYISITPLWKQGVYTTWQHCLISPNYYFWVSRKWVFAWCDVWYTLSNLLMLTYMIVHTNTCFTPANKRLSHLSISHTRWHFLTHCAYLQSNLVLWGKKPVCVYVCVFGWGWYFSSFAHVVLLDVTIIHTLRQEKCWMKCFTFSILLFLYRFLKLIHVLATQSELAILQHTMKTSTYIRPLMP